MKSLIVGQVLEFFAEHGEIPAIEWYNDGPTGPSAYVGITDYNTAGIFRSRFGVGWLSREGERQRQDAESGRLMNSRD